MMMSFYCNDIIMRSWMGTYPSLDDLCVSSVGLELLELIAVAAERGGLGGSSPPYCQV